MNNYHNTTTPITATELNKRYDKLDKQWRPTIFQSNSKEAIALAKQEARWEAEADYYHHAYLSADRF